MPRYSRRNSGGSPTAELRRDQYAISNASSTTIINFFSSSNQHFSAQQPLSLINTFLIQVFQTNPTPFTMAFFKSLLIASVAAVAFAAPQGGASDNNKKVEVDSKDSKAVCGNGQKLACCNSGEDLIGINCLSVPIRSSTLRLRLSWSQANISYSCCPRPTGLRF